MAQVLTVLLCHASNESIQALIRWWQKNTSIGNDLLIAHGGKQSDFDSLEWEKKVWISDSQLRTRDHQREKQSYQGVFQAAATYLEQHEYAYIYFAEYDHLPLSPKLFEQAIEYLEYNSADVLGHCLKRVDSTSNPHFLLHKYDTKFSNYWHTISQRQNQKVVLSMLGTGQLWRITPFVQVAKLKPPCAIYLELFIPTAAYHLGYKVAPHDNNVHWVSSNNYTLSILNRAQKEGVLTIHPIKKLPQIQ